MLMTSVCQIIVLLLLTASYSGKCQFSESCKDKVKHCKSYGKTICEEPYYFLWAFQNCAAFCDLCKYQVEKKSTVSSTIFPPTAAPSTTAIVTTQPSTTTTPSGVSYNTDTPPSACKDKLPYCALYKRTCVLQSYREWVLRSCRKTCGLCVPTTSVPDRTDNLEGKTFG